jgi:hypothetical protein
VRFLTKTTCSVEEEIMVTFSFFVILGFLLPFVLGQSDILTFETYKLFHSEKNSIHYGSLKTSFNLVTTTIENQSPELSKYIVLLRFADFNASSLSSVCIFLPYSERNILTFSYWKDKPELFLFFFLKAEMPR